MTAALTLVVDNPELAPVAPTVCPAAPEVAGFGGPEGLLAVIWRCPHCGAEGGFRTGPGWSLAAMVADAEVVFRAGSGCGLAVPGANGG